MENMDEINSIYEKVSKVISRDEYIERVNEKVEQMSGLCDEKTAAMLVAHDLGASDAGHNTVKIAEITPDSGIVNFIGKVISVFDSREFKRNDGTTGRVGNIVVGDETGTIRLTLWDDRAELINSGNIEIGQCLKISGYVKEGYTGLEVNIGNNNMISESDEMVDIKLSSASISDIKDGMGDINLYGKVLDKWDIREFNRRDGSKGRVCNILIGDSSGKIRVTLWDEKADFAEKIKADDTVEIINGYARENNFNQEVEIQIGSYGLIKKSDRSVEFRESFTPIADIVAGDLFSIKGHVSGIDEIKEFVRQDGTQDMVANIYVSDETGRIRLALWGEHATTVNDIDIDSRIEVIDAYSKYGLKDEIELNVGNRSKIIVI